MFEEMSEFDDSQRLMSFDATATQFFGQLYEVTQYLKLSTFLYTFHKVMATTKANVILKDTGTDFTTSHSQKDTIATRNLTRRV